MVLADSQAYEGDTVIWGGTVIKTQNTPRGSLLFILETPLGSRDYPEDADASAGRFIAKTDHFLDPLVYAKGRKVTVAGKVIGARTIANRKTKLSYTYPVVQVEQLHLWKQKAPLPPLPSYYYWDAWPDPIWGFPGYYGAFDYDEDDEDED